MLPACVETATLSSFSNFMLVMYIFHSLCQVLAVHMYLFHFSPSVAMESSACQGVTLDLFTKS